MTRKQHAPPFRHPACRIQPDLPLPIPVTSRANGVADLAGRIEFSPVTVSVPDPEGQVFP